VSAGGEFATWAAGLGFDDLPGDVVHSVKRHLLDGWGCALAAARMQASPYAKTLLDGGTEAVVIGGGAGSAARAAFANGVQIHALDFDDTHAKALVHPTAVIMPAVMALGQARDVAPSDVIVAAVAGYEIAARLGAAVTHGFHAAGFHATSVCGVFASAISSAQIMGLTVDQTVAAQGIAGSLAAGSLEFLETGSETKPLHAGFASMNGVLAAQLAHAGAEGPESIYEGRHGLFRTYLDKEVSATELTSALGSVWETTQITIKPYPACQLVHASLDALKACCQFDESDVESIEFQVPTGVSSIVGGKPAPRTEYEAKFSLEHCAAAFASSHKLTVSSFTRESIEAASSLAARISWSEQPFDGPPADAPGICTVRLRDGSQLHGRVERSKGGPDSPLTDEELIAKFINNGGTKQQADQMFELETLSSLKGLFA
jgi:2-methylcitrate dehydratase PrpD